MYHKGLHNFLVMLYFETSSLYRTTGLVPDREPQLEEEILRGGNPSFSQCVVQMLCWSRCS